MGDRMKMAHESLAQIKLKLEDELKSYKTELDALKKRFADLDRDNRKVTHEREELARAYKKSEEDKTKALHQVSVLEKELAQLKADFDKKFGASVQQYDITIKKLTAIEAEFKSMSANHQKCLVTIKDYETKFGGLSGQVQQLTQANTQLGQVKVKLEKDLSQVSKDYDDIARELKLADDRANKAGSDAHHFESLLREEQTKIVKIDNAKKALENEVRSLSVKIEEIETNSVATSKRTIQKMELRIEELETMINSATPPA